MVNIDSFVDLDFCKEGFTRKEIISRKNLGAFLIDMQPYFLEDIR